MLCPICGEQLELHNGYGSGFEKGKLKIDGWLFLCTNKECTEQWFTLSKGYKPEEDVNNRYEM